MTILFAWDFNGVLEKDCKKATIEVTNRALEEFGKPLMSEGKFQEMYGRPWIDFFKEMSPDSDDSEIDAMNARAYEISINEKPFLKFIQPMDNAAEVLSYIKGRGCKNIVVSNNSHESLLILTDSVGLTEFFDERVATDDFESDSRKDKSDAIIEYVKGKDIDKIVVIGDHPHDIEEGKKVGAVTYLFSHTGEFPDVDADYKISDLREVLKELI